MTFLGPTSFSNIVFDTGSDHHFGHLTTVDMIEQPVSNLLPVCESFQSVDIMDATACASDKFPPTDTPPDSTFPDEGSECGEELPTENSTFYSPVTPESISQVCVSTAMNSENQHEWVAKRLLVSILIIPS